MSINKILAPLVVAALVLAAGVYLLTSGSGQKTLTAHFPRTVSVYEGSDVRVLGVSVGEVTDVTPNGTDVEVQIAYDEEVKVPADAKAVIVAPSVVGDRYIQLTPVHTGGKVLADGAVLGTDRTSVPLELDQIYQSLDDLVVALGPDGANREGALTDLLQQTAANFGGQGAKLNSTITDVATLTDTLDANKDQLFGSQRKLQQFISTLAANDTTVREFARSLEDVSAMLAGERDDLAASLRNLSVALGDVTTFVKDNRALLKKNISGLNRVTGVLVRQREALEETLRTAPLALNNVALAYNPDTGTLDTNINLGKNIDSIVSDPSQLLCSILEQGTDGNAKPLCNLVNSLPLLRGQALGQGTGSSYGSPYDLSLGGLVEVD